jgi:hypothetical protein
VETRLTISCAIKSQEKPSETESCEDQTNLEGLDFREFFDFSEMDMVMRMDHCVNDHHKIYNLKDEL